MIRAPFCEEFYWDKTVKFYIEVIQDQIATLEQPSGNPRYRPQFVFQLAQKYWHLMWCRYSRGDDVYQLKQYFSPMLDAWEESRRLDLEINSLEKVNAKEDWTTNLDHYIVCFWLVGLALTLEVPDDQWRRLVAMLRNEGADALLDRVIATREPGRKIGTSLCHPKPYQRLLDAIEAPQEQQPQLLATFVENWYVELNRLPKNKKLSEDAAMYDRPYWYKYGETNMAGGAYFGQWCVEAAVVAKVFGIDDSLCVGHPQYPGDLLRPGKVTLPDMARLPVPLRKWQAQMAASSEQREEAISRNEQGIAAWVRRLLRKS